MDKKSFSLICAIVTSILWGSAFVAQDMGMDFIGPHTFNVGRFLIGFLRTLGCSKSEKNQVKASVFHTFWTCG